VLPAAVSAEAARGLSQADRGASAHAAIAPKQAIRN